MRSSETSGLATEAHHARHGAITTVGCCGGGWRGAAQKDSFQHAPELISAPLGGASTERPLRGHCETE